MIVALDLDRTLFNTTAFYDGVTKALHQKHGVDPQEFMEAREDYHVHNETLRHYEFYQHVAQFGIEEQITKDLVLNTIPANSLLYDDVEPFLQFLRSKGIEPFVVTYGTEPVQGLKLALVPLLKDYKAHIVLEPKGQYLQKLAIEGDMGIIIDDKVVEDLPQGMKHVLIDRSGKAGKYQDLISIQKDWEIITK